MNFFSGKDIIGLAETGSGKTGAFAIPVIHNPWLNFPIRCLHYCNNHVMKI